MAGQAALRKRPSLSILRLRRWWQVVVEVIQRIDGWNHIFLFSPGAEVDLFASVGAERAKFAQFRPFHFGAASRAIDCRNHNQKLHKLNSKGTSPSKAFGFMSPSCDVKRTHSMYLLAEISGIAPSVSSIVRRNIW